MALCWAVGKHGRLSTICLLGKIDKYYRDVEFQVGSLLTWDGARQHMQISGMFINSLKNHRLRTR